MKTSASSGGSGFSKGLGFGQAPWKADHPERILKLSSFKQKSILFLVAITLLYFAGVAAIIYPMLSNIYSLSNSKTVIAEYAKEVEQMPDTQKSELFELANKYNADVADNKFGDGLEKCLCRDDGLMCYVDIPTISVFLPVYYGTSDEVLAKGAGYVENTSLPVGGESVHSVISAHTGLPSADMFTKLDQVGMGDVFYIHVLDEVLAYKVELIKTVMPSEVENLYVVPGNDFMTLLTCTPYGINDHRLLVRGTRVPYEPQKTTETSGQQVRAVSAESANEGLAEEINRQTKTVVLICVAAGAMYIGAMMWLLVTFKTHSRQMSDNMEESDVSDRKTD